MGLDSHYKNAVLLARKNYSKNASDDSSKNYNTKMDYIDFASLDHNFEGIDKEDIYMLYDKYEMLYKSLKT
jgi:hypothetical protein